MRPQEPVNKTPVSTSAGSYRTNASLSANTTMDSDVPLQFLNGKHLLVSGLDAGIDLHMKRNASGYILEPRGVSALMFPWLSLMFNFTYSYLQVNATPLDDTLNRQGLLTYLKNEECDIVATVTPTVSRAAIVDLTHPSIYIPVTFAIPPPDTSVNVLAVFEPFQFWVWMGAVMSYLSVVLVLTGFLTYFKLSDPKNQNGGKGFSHVISIYYQKIFKPVEHFSKEKLSVRLVVAAWCVGTLILAIVYTTLLISAVAAPNPKPLIKSIFEMRNRSDLNLITDKDRNVAILLLTSENGFYKELGDRIRSFPDGQCMPQQQCVDLLKSRHNIVYIGGKEGALIPAMKDDLTLTGQCNFQISNEYLMQLKLSWALKKSSPFLDNINYGFMRMREFGLLPYWYKNETPNVNQCMKNQESGHHLDDGSSLTLKGLSGAFAVLFAGIALSLLIFICENIIGIIHFHGK